MIREDYDYSNQWYDLGAYRKLLGDYAGAIDAYDFVTLIRPNDVISYMNLGEIYAVYLKNYGQAEKNYLQAIKNDPTKASSYMYLSSLYSIYPDKEDQEETILLD